ncbi:MAG: helix-hairpin-helix domain-containing protein [Candidatus Dormibacteria bacterium]
MRNDQYSALLNRIADLLEIKGDLFFKVRSYREAARQIDELAEAVDLLRSEGRVETLPGIGKAIAEKLAEYGDTGKLAFLERLEEEVPPGLLDFLRIPGLGPKTAKEIYDTLHITTLDGLEAALRDGSLRQVPKIKARTEENIARGLEALKGRGAAGPRTLLPVAMAIADRFTEALQALPEVELVAPAGSLRRRAESIGDLDLVVASTNPGQVMEAFCNLEEVESVIARGETKSSIKTIDGMQVDLRVVPPAHYGAALVYFTGSKAHNVKMRALALRRGLTLNEYGLARLAPQEPESAEPAGEATAARSVGAAGGKRSRAVVESEQLPPGATEEQVYRALGLSWVPPVQREDRGELALAAEAALPPLLTVEEIRGDLHSHSNNSDGRNTIAEMFEAAATRGYAYLNMTDHSKSAGIITGIEAGSYPDQVARVRAAAATAAQRHPGFRGLCGVEVNILPDGSLDLPDEILAEMDVVVASVHNQFNLPREQMTARVCRAVASPHVDVLGHPTGRKVEARQPYEIDLEEVFRAALKNRTAVEINANPHRLDLNDVYARRARELGLKVSIGSDAHHLRELENIKFGVFVAQRAWLQPEDVINCWDVERLLAFTGS